MITTLNPDVMRQHYDRMNAYMTRSEGRGSSEYTPTTPSRWYHYSGARPVRVTTHDAVTDEQVGTEMMDHGQIAWFLQQQISAELDVVEGKRDGDAAVAGTWAVVLDAALEMVVSDAQTGWSLACGGAVTPLVDRALTHALHQDAPLYVQCEWEAF